MSCPGSTHADHGTELIEALLGEAPAEIATAGELARSASFRRRGAPVECRTLGLAAASDDLLATGAED